MSTFPLASMCCTFPFYQKYNSRVGVELLNPEEKVIDAVPAKIINQDSVAAIELENVYGHNSFNDKFYKSLRECTLDRKIVRKIFNLQ